MAEAGGPTIAEMQPKPVGVVDRVKDKLREFTPQGRAEVMAQKQIDEILKQVPEEKRVEAMKMLEARRPDLVASNLPGAKDRLVKEAVVGAAVLGILAVGGGVAILKKKEIGGFMKERALDVYKHIPEGGKDALAKARIETDILRHRVKTATSGATDRVSEAMKSIKDRFVSKVATVSTPPSNLIDALSGAIKLDALDVLDKTNPVKLVFLNQALAPGVFMNSELQNTEGESFVRKLLKKASESGRWVPVVVAKGQEPYGFGDDWEGVGGLIKRGLVTVQELKDGKKLFVPTKEFVEFVGRHIAKNEAFTPKD